MAKNIIEKIVLALVTIGAINWGLVGLFNFDIVAALLGAGSIASRVIYSLVGFSGVYSLVKILTK